MRTIAEFFDRPLALRPATAFALLKDAGSFTLAATSSPTRTPYDIVSGVAVIPVCGVLVHERSWWSWDETVYSDIGSMIAMAMVDDQVKGVALEINSPGGTVSGCFDLCDAIYQMRDLKPIWAFINESGYSAAYAIASCAERIILPRTGGVGSVGVITMHIDITKMLDEAGIKVTTVQYGDRKSDSYPTTPLSDEARERLQADVDELGELFVATVARNRGIKRSAVRNTEAGCFMGESAINVGFADAVMSIDQAVVEFIDGLRQ